MEGSKEQFHRLTTSYFVRNDTEYFFKDSLTTTMLNFPNHDLHNVEYFMTLCTS